MLTTKNAQDEDGGWKMATGIFQQRAECHLSAFAARHSAASARRRPFAIRHFRFFLFPALAVFLSGCAPAGPRALLKGERLLERGDYAAAAAQLKTATTLLATNAAAWNYYGVALQRAGQPAEAAAAYQNALKFDRDLMEAHYNLGCLWLEQNKPDMAKTEFTAYTLRRNNAPEGWLKLGAAQLKLHDLLPAEKSFSTARSLDLNNAEALNGLGLARVEGGHPQDAARFFSAAIEAHHDYAPALLNLGTVNRQYLHDDAQALENYRKYLALTPRPADWDAVNALVNNFGQAATVATASPPPVKETKPPAPTPPPATETKPTAVVKETKPAQAASTLRPAASPKSQPNGRNNASPPAQVVQVQPAPEIVTTPTATAPAAEPPSEPGTQKPGVWHRLNPAHWFDGPPAPEKNYTENGVTPLPSVDSTAPAPTPPANAAAGQPESEPAVAAPKPVKITPPAPPMFPRYLYLSPRKPRAGDRKAAARAFAEAQQFEQKPELAEAVTAYQKAAGLDPSWFEAQYNYGVLAYRQEDYNRALAAYEMALAIRPDSADARYNFALVLKAAGYMTDAVGELKKVVAAKPDEARAHLSLGNLYAQQLRDPALARREYLRVLALDPRNPQAGDIQFWLSANPP